MEQEEALAQNSGGDVTNLADVLGLVVRHQRNTLDLTDLCCLLRVSNSCRLAVQQSRSEQRVKFEWDAMYQEDEMHAYWQQRKAKLQGFAEWLPKHAGLISSIWLNLTFAADESRLLQRHLALALRMCRLNVEAAAATAAAAERSGGTGLAAAAKPVRLRLETCRFAGSFPEQQLLQELGAAGLQELEVVDVEEHPEYVPPSYLDSLSSSLQSLTLQSPLSDSLRAAVESLTALTRLKLGRVPAGLDWTGQWPPMLQDLAVCCDVPGDGAEGDGAVLPPTITMDSLAGLQRLSLILISVDVAGRATWGAEDVPQGGLETLALPPNLTSLSMYARKLPVSRVTGANSLQEMLAEGLTDASSVVLTHLCRLPGIRSLHLGCSMFDTPEASGAVVTALGSAKGLTGLSFSNVGFAAGTGLCRQLASLPGLKSLAFSQVGSLLDPSDWLHLTALTSLTKLLLDDNIWADDVVVAVLACHLTGLCDLCVRSASISSRALLPVVGALTGLTRLILRGGPRFVVLADKLMLLSGLTQLAELEIRTLGCSEAEKQQFREGLPRLRDF